MDGYRGPFLLTVTSSPPLLPAPAGLAASHDELVRTLVAAGAATKRWLAPWCLRLATYRCAAFATAVWMVDRVHHRAAYMWASPKVARASGFADAHILVV